MCPSRLIWLFLGSVGGGRPAVGRWWRQRRYQVAGLGALAFSWSRFALRHHSSHRMAVIDSHLHVWSESGAALARPAPPGLQDDSLTSAEGLLATMAASGVGGALIVQPINYEFDHSYVASALARHPTKFKGMLLAGPETTRAQLEELQALGFTGVRLNPGLWPSVEEAFEPQLFEACAELRMPVGVMAFGGLLPLADHIERLAKRTPTLPIVLDHWGFPRAKPAEPPSSALAIDEQAWDRLLDLARLPNVYVKVSALFRVSSQQPPYDDLEPRFARLLEACGPNRLMWGSDFPYAILQPGGYAAQLAAVTAWANRAFPDDDAKVDAILAGTARQLFQFESA